MPLRPLIGRTEALTAIRDLLLAAHAGSGGGLLVEGIAGIGKSALLNFAAEEAASSGFVVRRSIGVPIEADLPFGALMDVFADQGNNGSSELTPSALTAAISRQSVAVASSLPPPSWIEVASAAIEVLSRLGRDRPQMLVVDDVQWADASSVAVFGHIARHAVADRVAVMFARRVSPTQNQHDRELAGVPGLQLELLTNEEAIEVLSLFGCPADEAEQWTRRCGGLPLAINEVGRRHLSLEDRATVRDALPELYREQIRTLAPAAVAALTVLALGDDAGLVRSIGGDSAVRALRVAAQANVIQLEGDESMPIAHFRHPLLRAAVLAVSTTAQERTVNRQLAAVLVETGDLDRGALHLAAATPGTDIEAAAAMTSMAERAIARGALVEGARAFVRAAALSEDPDVRSSLLRRSADASFDYGDSSVALSVIEQSVHTARDPGVAAEARVLRARMSLWVHSPNDTVRELLAIADDVRSTHPTLAASALAAASLAGHLQGDLALAIERGREAERIATEEGGVVMAAGASGLLAWNSCFVGDWDECEARMRPLEPLMRALLASRSWAGLHLAEMIGTTWVCGERWSEAEPLIRELVHVARTMGARLKAASATLLLGSLCWRQGRWDEAYALERPLLEDTNIPPITLAWMRVLVAQLTATMGKIEETRELIELGLPVAIAADVPLIIATANAVLGHVELSVGNDEVALTHLDRTAAITERMGFVEPEYFLWHGDLLEALVRVGRGAEAAEHAAKLAKIGAAGGRRWVVGVAKRTQAQLASTPDEANAAFEDSLGAFVSLGMPFEVARTLLARGTSADLSDAHRLFLRLGATVWAEVCGKKADAIGGNARAAGTATATASSLLERLTPAERNVALAVVSGRTNREIAAELHLSVKTIDHYLQQAYRRIGVRNRTELAVAIARSIAPPTR